MLLGNLIVFNDALQPVAGNYKLGGQLVLLGGSRAVYRVFELAGVDRYFAWSDSPSGQTVAELDRELGGGMRS